MKKKLLIVAAHPDDEVLGCGATVSHLIRDCGYEAYSLILGEGVTARDRYRDRKKRNKELKLLKYEMLKANKILGINKVFSFGLPDNRFDTLPLLEVIKIVEEIKNKIKPEIIFTHFYNDLNIDHRITFQSVLTASRPIYDESVKKIYSFEILSSTEWSYPQMFNPQIFFDVTKTIGIKVKAMQAYKSELRPYPHPRSAEFIIKNSEFWGARMNIQHAEAFHAIRVLE